MLSRHFKREEAACSCGCGFDAADIDVLKILEKVRYHFNAAVIVNSWCRCEDYNILIGGAKSSQHVLGKAADFTVIGVPPSVVQEYLKNWKGGLGSYENFTHVDVGRKRRWVG